MTSITDFPKIDAHIHFNADRTSLLELANDYNFDLLTINTEVPDFPPINKQKKNAMANRDKTNSDLRFATTISTKNVFEDGWADKTISNIRRDVATGACGVKFWKNIGMSIQRSDGAFLMLDDPELIPIFNFLEKEQIPVLGHQGEPKNCWLPVEEMTVQSDRKYFAEHPQYHMYKHGEYPGYWQHINARDTILQRHPNLPFIGLHLASLEWSLDEIASRLEKFPNLAIDLAERISHLYHHAANNRDKLIDFFKEYQDRIIYGTDIIDQPDKKPVEITEELQHRWETHWQFFFSENVLTSPQISASFQGLNLPTSILEKIYRVNAINWYQY